MDETVKVFQKYFRDIYSASAKTCAGACDEATPASLGPNAYELRQCCKQACSDESIKSELDCVDRFCKTLCMQGPNECMAKCTVGCHRRFNSNN